MWYRIGSCVTMLPWWRISHDWYINKLSKMHSLSNLHGITDATCMLCCIISSNNVICYFWKNCNRLSLFNVPEGLLDRVLDVNCDLSLLEFHPPSFLCGFHCLLLCVYANILPRSTIWEPNASNGIVLNCKPSTQKIIIQSSV